jgi:hypothetical protein
MNAWGRFIHPVTAHFRKRRGLILRALWPGISEFKIADVGGSRHFWEKVDLAIPHRQITIYNIEEGTARGSGRGDAQDIRIILYHGKRVDVADGHFDLVVCNSVLEHLPSAQRAAFAREISRIGQRTFVQTPAFVFPIEPHFVMPFLHWLPRSIAFLLVHVSPWRFLSRPTKQTIHRYFHETRLLRRRELAALFPHSTIVTETLLG